ncbi:MAG: hypothetical protein U5K79_18880 [Cyclobacteriaceae bacterium]|nr:hypothetical protein [Cyclobacteriaceae bacterium]
MLIRIATFFLSGFFIFEHNQSEWKKELDKDGIIIHTRKIDGSQFHEFLAETRMPGTIPAFKKVLSDVTNYPDWMPDCKSAELIGIAKQNEFTYYMELSVPFPIADRCTMQHVRFSETPGLNLL